MLFDKVVNVVGRIVRSALQCFSDDTWPVPVGVDLATLDKYYSLYDAVKSGAIIVINDPDCKSNGSTVFQFIDYRYKCYQALKNKGIYKPDEPTPLLKPGSRSMDYNDGVAYDSLFCMSRDVDGNVYHHTFERALESFEYKVEPSKVASAELKELNRLVGKLPCIGDNRYGPIAIPHPHKDGETINVVVGKSHESSCFVSYYPIDRNENGRLADGLQTCYHAGIHNVPKTANELTDVLNKNADFIRRQLAILDDEYNRSREKLQFMLNNLMGLTDTPATITERYTALIEMKPHLSKHPRLRSITRLNHSDLDTFGVPRLRSEFNRWRLGN